MPRRHDASSSVKIDSSTRRPAIQKLIRRWIASDAVTDVEKVRVTSSITGRHTLKEYFFFFFFFSFFFFPVLCSSLFFFSSFFFVFRYMSQGSSITCDTVFFFQTFWSFVAIFFFFLFLFWKFNGKFVDRVLERMFRGWNFFAIFRCYRGENKISEDDRICISGEERKKDYLRYVLSIFWNSKFYCYQDCRDECTIVENFSKKKMKFSTVFDGHNHFRFRLLTLIYQKSISAYPFRFWICEKDS